MKPTNDEYEHRTVAQNVTYLDRHSSDMEAMKEQDAFSQQSLVSSREFDFRDGESMSEMRTVIHVGEWEVSEPFRNRTACQLARASDLANSFSNPSSNLSSPSTATDQRNSIPIARARTWASPMVCVKNDGDRLENSV